MNKTIKQYAFVVVATIILASCGSKRSVNNVQNDTETISSQQNVISGQAKHTEQQGMKTTKVDAKIGEFAKTTDPLTIDTVLVEGNTMFIHVNYGGGCTTHEFELIGSPLLAKSYPPIRTLQLVHRANNDLCLAMVQNIIEVDISPLVETQKEGNEIFFVIEGWKQRIHHTYSAEK